MSKQIVDLKPRDDDSFYVNLGNSGLRVSRFSYGGWLTDGGTVKGDPVKQNLKLALENGINFFDNAETYAAGKSEEEWGRAFEELGTPRDSIVLTTKLFFGTGRPGPNARGNSRKHIIEGLDASLKRLRTDYVDVVFAHRHDAATPIEETVRAFNHVINQGKAHYWGTSEWSAEQITEAILIADRLNLIRPIAEQPHHSLLHRIRIERELLPVIEKYNYGSTIWSPLESGLLTGKYVDLVENGPPAGSRYATNPEFFKETVEKFKTPEGKAKLEQVSKLVALAKELDTTATRLALAWTIRPGSVVSTTILGASKPEQLLDNLAALDVVAKITPEVAAKLDEIFPKPELPTTYGRQRYL